MKHFYCPILLLFISFLLSSCKLNDTLTGITESISNISINSNSSEYETKETNNKTKVIQKNELEVKKRNSNNMKSSDKEDLKVVKDQKNPDKINIAEEKRLAFLSKDLKASKENIQKLKYPNIIGLLIPLTGDRSYVGQFVINSVRFYLDQNDIDIKIKVFDTKSTPNGAMEALKSGLNSRIYLFIGPVFSDETIALKNISLKTDVLIFSLSTDQKAASDNVIISGSNLLDEVSCITKNITSRGHKKVALIHSGNEYGKVLKENFEENNKNLDITYLEINSNTDLDKTLREFSDFDQRKFNLNKEISRVINSDLEDIQKEQKVNFLKNQTTFGGFPHEALIIGKEGSRLIEILSILAFYDINSSNTFIIGTSKWDDIDKFAENVLDNTFYVSGFKLDKSDYNSKYSSIFSSRANNLNHVVNDVISLALQINYVQYPNKNIFKREFYSQYSQGNISKDRVLNRVVYLNKKNRRKVTTVDLCPLDVNN